MAAEPELPEEDRAAIRDVLLNWRAEGQENPLLPMEVDADGDGIVDSWGLDENDEVVFVSGVALTETVFQSDGDGIVEGR
jgi:hypothetical protein